ncbi:MAG: hypothetical protein KDD38_06140 [Bdellovibrionales bacterium]|nr:hypothetical protein [Bdellovibrionales bacterium]
MKLIKIFRLHLQLKLRLRMPFILAFIFCATSLSFSVSAEAKISNLFRWARKSACVKALSLNTKNINSNELRLPHHTYYSTRLDLIKQFAQIHSQDQKKMISFLKRFYGKENYKLLMKRFGEHAADLLPLMFDIGILHHIPEFLEFLEQEKLQASSFDPWELREKFSNHLGTTRIYRAIALTDRELSIAKTQGLTSRILRNLTLNDWPIYDFELQETYDSHSHGNGSTYYSDNSYLISVSDFQEVSIAVANHHSEQNKPVYLFELEIPRLDILPIGDRTSFIHPTNTPPNVLKIISGNKRASKHKIFFGRKLESFIMFRIDPSEITSITKISAEDPLARLNFLWE